jgi:hypothetical protein
LVGTALVAGKGSARSVVIPTHEWVGDVDERLDFPGSWEVNVLNMKGHNAPVLTQEEIRKQLSNRLLKSEVL